MELLSQDILRSLLERQMHHIIDSILVYLDESSLRNCLQVSTTWNLITKNDKIWKKLYQKLSKKEPILEGILQRRLNMSVNTDSPIAEEISFLKLFEDKLKVDTNWMNGHFTTNLLDLGSFKISMLRMDAKRIVGRAWRFPGPHSIVVWNRWTLQTECVIAVPHHSSWIRDLQLYGDYIFSLHDLGSILIWDLNSQSVVFRFNQEQTIPGSYWVQTLVAHGFVISCFRVFNVAMGSSLPETLLTLYDVSKPPLKFTLKHTEYMKLCTFRGIQSDNIHFVLFLFCLGKKQIKIQLRSIETFLVIRELFIPLDLDVRYSYHSGRLITLSIENNTEIIKIWEIENVHGEQMLCKMTLPAPTRTFEIALNSRHLIMRVSHNCMIIWDVRQIFNQCTSNIETRKMPKENLFLHKFVENCLAFLFDDLQIITVSVSYVGRPPVGCSNNSFLTVRQFL